MEEIYKEVYFSEYCKTCKHKELDGTEEPCDTCLETFVNAYSHKPVMYEKSGS